MADHKSDNFEFVQGTYWGIYYEDLINCEKAYYEETLSKLIYMISRTIAEDMAGQIEQKERGYNQGRTFDDYLKGIDSVLPKKIKKYFYQFKNDGNIAVHPPDGKKYRNNPQSTLQNVHYCLIWYLQKFEDTKIEESSFMAPIHEKIEKLEWLHLIKQMEAKLEEAQKELEEVKKRKEQELNKAVLDIEERDQEIKALQRDKKKAENQLQEKDRELQKANQQLEAAEIASSKIAHSKERDELLHVIAEHKKELQERKREISQLKEMLEDVSGYDTYEDADRIWEINILEESLADDLDELNYKLEQTSREINRLKDLFSGDHEIQDSRHPLFYKSFTNLEGEQLRSIYVILEKINSGSILFNTFKNKITRSDFDAMQAFVETEASKMAVLSDQEVRLRLYYKLMDIGNINGGCIINEKEFKANCDKIVDFAYGHLKGKKDFEGSANKLEAINKYYMNKAIIDFEAKYNAADGKDQNRLMDEIYNNFEKMPPEQRKDLYDKLGIKSTSEAAVKNSMKAIGPTVLLSTLVSIGGFTSYTTLSSIIFAVSQLLGVTFSFSVYTGAASLLSFLTGPFMIFLLIGSGYFIFRQGKKQKEDLVPLAVMQMCISETSLNYMGNHEKNYAQMVELWNEAKEIYDSKKGLKNQSLEHLRLLQNNKAEFEGRLSLDNQELDSLNRQFEQDKNKFLHHHLLPSEKKRSLNSYYAYQDNVDKLKAIQGNFGSGTGLKKYLSMAKDKILEVPLAKNIGDLEKILLVEAMNSGIFAAETTDLRSLQNRIAGKMQNIADIKKQINSENNNIKQEKGRLKGIEDELKKIQAEYLDIDC